MDEITQYEQLPIVQCGSATVFRLPGASHAIIAQQSETDPDTWVVVEYESGRAPEVWDRNLSDGEAWVSAAEVWAWRIRQMRGQA